MIKLDFEAMYYRFESKRDNYLKENCPRAASHMEELMRWCKEKHENVQPKTEL